MATFQPIIEVAKEGSDRFNALANTWLSQNDSSPGDEATRECSDKEANGGLYPVNEVNEGKYRFYRFEAPCL